MTDTVRSSDGTTLAFDRSGDGPPLVLVGGALSDRFAAAALAGHLAERFTVIAYDRRGRGDSGDTAPYAVDREVDDLLALIVDAGGSAFMFGHSSGAALALEAAAHGLPIAKLALYEPPFIVDESRPEVPRDYVTRVEELVTADRRGDAVEYFMTVAVGMPADLVTQMRSSPMWPSMEALAHTIPYDGRVMGDAVAGSPEPLERWASVTIPTLVMDGGASPDWQHNAVGALVDVLPNVRHRTLEGQGHGPADEVLAPALIEFFTAEE
jgi:pimeloyl-ACP methyl ester carboxylesterase